MGTAAHAARRSSSSPAAQADRGESRAQPVRSPAVREISCPCGGGCPRCSGAHHGRRDAHEAEAHAAGARISALAAPGRRSGTSTASPAPASASHASRAATAPGRRRDHAATARGPPGRPRSAIRRTAAPTGLAGSGERLSPADRDRFEPLLRCDLSAVRVHHGPAAASLARAERAHAFTRGSHIVLGDRAAQAPGHVRAEVLAHELAHVGQQAASPSPAHPARGPPLTRAPIAVQRLGEEDSSILPAWVGEAASSVADVGSAAVSTVVEAGGEAVEFVAENFAAIVETLAPGLLGILRGGLVGRFADFLCEGVDALLGRLFSGLADIDLMSAIESTFSSLTAGVQGLQARLGGAASAALGTLLAPLVEGLQVFGGPLIETIRSAATTVNGLFSAVWDNLAAPALDFLQAVGGVVWQNVSALITSVWDLTAPIRNTAAAAWEWVSEQFGIAWGSTADVRTTLAAQAAEAWQSLLTTIEPIRRPLQVAGGVLLLLSPLGPIVVLTQVLPPLWEKLTWLWNNWNAADILVTARTTLQQDVLPAIIGAVSGVASALASAATWLSQTIAGVGTALAGVLGAFGGSRCLAAVTTYLNGIAAQFTRLAAWAQSGFAGLAPAVTAVLGALVAILRPIVDFLVRLTMVVANPIMLPVALTAAIWLLVPPELKPPIVGFVLDLLIAVLEVVPAPILLLGPMAGVMKAAFLGFLRELRGGGAVADDTRVAAANKIADIAAGGGVDFVAGFALGLLHGIIDGIIDPFRLIFLLLRLLVSGAMAIGRALTPYLRESVPGFGTAIDAATMPGAPRGPPAEAAPPEAAPAAEGPTDAEIVAGLPAASLAEHAAGASEPAVDEAALEASARTETETSGSTVGGLAELLGDAWTSILAGAERLGATIAGALLRFIAQPAFQIGRDLGFVAGFILLQALIIYFSAGGYAALKGVEPALRQVLVYVLRFLDLGGEIFAVLGRALRPLRGAITSGLGAFRSFLQRFSFARAILERLERLAARLFRFGDEAAEAATSRAAATTAREGSERAASEAAQETSERAAVEAADDLGPGAVRAADEPGVPTLADDALKATQFAEAEIAIRAVAEANDRLNAPVPVVLAELMVLKRRYRWIEGFAARPTSPGHFRIVFFASPEHVADADYTPISVDDLVRQFPDVRPMNAKRREALAFIGTLPNAERDFLIAQLRRLPAEQQGPMLTQIADLSRQVADPDALAALLRARRTGVAATELTPLQTHLADEAPQIIDEAAGEVDNIVQTVTRRVSPDEIRAARSALRRRMTPPPWADEGWEAHHIIPVEFQDHRVFDALTSRPPGWDHHNIDINGIALPTTLDGQIASGGLPVHQATDEVLEVLSRRGPPGAPRAPIPEGVLPDLAFHPQYSARVRSALDAMEPFIDDPVRLRAEVERLAGELRDEITSGRWNVLL